MSASQMMRVSQVSRSDRVIRLRIEGRITQPASTELLAAVERCLTERGAVLLDLANVAFADASGVDTLLALQAKGVVMMACSGFLSEMMRADAGGAAHQATLLAAAEHDLIRRLRDGDEDAFAELVAQNSGRLLATAKRLLRNEDEARDAVQEAFLSAFRSLATFNATARLSTWLHRIVVNAALMRLRSRKQRSEQPIENLLPRFDSDGTWEAAAGEAVASSCELLERRERRVLVRRCIDQLPEAYRTILLLRDIEDLDTGETAERLDITPNAVKIRLHRARQALRTLVASQDEAPSVGRGQAAAH